ncbi:MAG: LysR family transcriptional regulator, partial [Acetivibrio sp.]
MEGTLSAYRIFYVVAQKGNISYAAKELYISQPAISKAIGKLEESLGVLLFFRSSRGVVLTEEGKILYEHTKKAFETLEEGEENLRKIQNLEMGQIRIGASTTLCKYILMPYLKAFIKKYPH